jgi:hypothetical protein
MMNSARLIMFTSDPDSSQQELRASTFDVITRRKRITFFKLGKVWVFKHFFDNKETFKALAESYNEDKFRFEFKTFGERNNALKILDRAGFDYELVEDLRPFVVKLSRYSKYAPLLKNSIAHMETADWRIFLMKDQAAVEEAMRMGADMYQGDYSSLMFK